MRRRTCLCHGGWCEREDLGQWSREEVAGEPAGTRGKAKAVYAAWGLSVLLLPENFHGASVHALWVAMNS